MIGADQEPRRSDQLADRFEGVGRLMPVMPQSSFFRSAITAVGHARQ
jgi:hypothetical protein